VRAHTRMKRSTSKHSDDDDDDNESDKSEESSTDDGAVTKKAPTAQRTAKRRVQPRRAATKRPREEPTTDEGSEEDEEESSSDDASSEEGRRRTSAAKDKTRRGSTKKGKKVAKKTTSPAKTKQRRRAYTAEENQAMLDWLEMHGAEVRGNVFKAMAAAHVTAHSWKSMRNHFANKLTPLLRRPTLKSSDGDDVDVFDGRVLAGLSVKLSDDEDDLDEKKLHWSDGGQMAAALQRHASAKNALQSGKTAPVGPAGLLIETIARSPAAKALARSQVRVAREAFVRQLVADLMERTKAPLPVVLHALVVHNGDAKAAQRYLLSQDILPDTADGDGGGSKGEPTAAKLPWTVDEDRDVLHGDAEARQKVIDKRGGAAVAARVRFLTASAQVDALVFGGSTAAADTTTAITTTTDVQQRQQS